MLKSLVVAAPAGSGKTEELSRRYIELLQDGVKPERILTLTFTEKAAAEMKERILKRLREDHPSLYRTVRENILRLRISTIHSFCFSLLRRFAPHIGLDPALEALDEAGSAVLWNRALYDTLARIAAESRNSADYRTLMDLVTQDKSQTWGKLTGLFSTFYSRRTAVEHARAAEVDDARFGELARRLRSDPAGPPLVPQYKDLFPPRQDPDALAAAASLMQEHESTFLTSAGEPRKRGFSAEQREWAGRLADYRGLLLTKHWYTDFDRMFDLFRRRFLSAYDEYKREAGQVDFTDMEHRALRVITEDDQWQNVLYAFDEQTDHLLVDEFQDTSYLQWAIVRKLTEEWRSGEGAKSDRGIEPTIFIVGDVKQSIYLFRDAKVEVFAQARDELRAALGDRLEEKPIRYNYRSLQAIVDFVNALFSRLMSPPASGVEREAPDVEHWRTRYERFERGRRNDAPGRVEILLDRNDGKMDERRTVEADLVARRIKSLVGRYEVFAREPGRPETPRLCEHGDIAILLRTRNHLDFYTDALRRHGIPFIAVGGTGFYSEPEVCHLKSLLYFLVDPTDGLSLYALLRGPLFRVPERDLLLANSEPGRFLWDRLRAYAAQRPAIAPVATALANWLGQVNRLALVAILEQALSERGAWTVFWEPQRVANIRKFLHIIEGMELKGRHPLRIIEFLESSGVDEKRADVSVETSKAVQIVTIHGAKGLQFPVVFYPGLDLTLSSGRARDGLLIEERGPDEAWVSFIPDSRIRNANPFHAEFAQKEAEEEKRVCYVACTRASDALFLSGIWNARRQNTSLAWLEEHLGLQEVDRGFRLAPEIPGVHCLTAQDIPAPAPAPAEKKAPKPPVRTAPLAPQPAPTVRAITRNLPRDRKQHDEQAIGLGEVIHSILEKVSRGTLSADRETLTAEIDRLLRHHGLASSLSANLQSAISNLQSETSIWSIIAPQPNSEAELPIMYSDGATILTGRIDRLIVSDGEVRIYDYKTFPVKRQDIPALAKEYHDGQLRYYADACRRLYPGKKVSTFLIFTALPELVQTS
jgi:ATP-dependent helicase/nuclease subunit A